MMPTSKNEVNAVAESDEQSLQNPMRKHECPKQSAPRRMRKRRGRWGTYFKRVGGGQRATEGCMKWRAKRNIQNGKCKKGEKQNATYANTLVCVRPRADSIVYARSAGPEIRGHGLWCYKLKIDPQSTKHRGQIGPNR